MLHTLGIVGLSVIEVYLGLMQNDCTNPDCHSSSCSMCKALQRACFINITSLSHPKSDATVRGTLMSMDLHIHT